MQLRQALQAGEMQMADPQDPQDSQDSQDSMDGQGQRQ